MGAEIKTLIANEMPVHNHLVNVINAEGIPGEPGGKILAAGHDVETIYSDGTPNRTMAAGMIGNTGGNQPFSIQDPTLVVRYCVALQGLYPSRN